LIDLAIGDDVTVTSFHSIGKPHPAGDPDTANRGDEGTKAR